MNQILEFDCRTICEGRRCPHLHPNKDMRLAKSIKMFICRDKNLIIMSEMMNQGKTTEKIISVAPFNSCVQMRKLQEQGLAQWAELVINPDGTATRWNNPIETP